MREKNPVTHDEKLAYLRELREEAIHAGSEEAVEKQHAKGKLTARERIDKLLDPGSFEELDTFVRHRTHEFDMDKRRPYGDAVVTGACPCRTRGCDGAETKVSSSSKDPRCEGIFFIRSRAVELALGMPPPPPPPRSRRGWPGGEGAGE